LKLSLYIDSEDFACKGMACCGNSFPADRELLQALDELQALVCLLPKYEDAQIKINSGFRCRTHNRAVNGSFSSFHTRGMAADIRVDNMPPHVLACLAIQIASLSSGGIGVYSTFIHVDVRRTGPARW